MRYYRRSRLRSSRGHVRVDPSSPWSGPALWVGAAVLGVVLLILLISQVVVPALEGDEERTHNRTWLEFKWTSEPVSPDAVQSLGKRLAEHNIDRVYVEAAAWLSDGSLLYGDYAAQFAQALRQAYPKIEILLWLRMTAEQIANADQRDQVVELARTGVREWGFDGAQLNGFGVVSQSGSYVTLLRALGDALGEKVLLSVTVPPDRIPADPDVPASPAGVPELTWDVEYKQQVGLLNVDEAVIMAHASGLTDAAEYERWVAYQVESYVQAFAGLERPPDLIIALPTYDAAPEHDPAVEDVRAAARGTYEGIKQAGEGAKLIKGAGLYEYKTTDSLEWQLYAEHWLGKKK